MHCTTPLLLAICSLPGFLQPREGDSEVSAVILFLVLVPCSAFGAEEVQDAGLEHRL